MERVEMESGDIFLVTNLQIGNANVPESLIRKPCHLVQGAGMDRVANQAIEGGS